MIPLPLVLTPRASRVLIGLRVAVHGLAALAVMLLDAPPPLPQLGVLALGASLAWSLWPRRLPELRCGGEAREREAISELRLRPAGDATQAWQHVQRWETALLTPWLVLLRVQPPGARRARTLAILPDSLPPEAFRRLRVWLRWGSAGVGAQDSA